MAIHSVVEILKGIYIYIHTMNYNQYELPFEHHEFLAVDRDLWFAASLWSKVRGAPPAKHPDPKPCLVGLSHHTERVETASSGLTVSLVDTDRAARNLLLVNMLHGKKPERIKSIFLSDTLQVDAGPLLLEQVSNGSLGCHRPVA